MRIFKVPLRRVYGQNGLRGYGLGGLFSRLGRYVTPLLKNAFRAARPIAKRTLKELGKQGIQAAGQTALDVLSGESPKHAAAKNLRRAAPRAKGTLKAGMKRGVSSIRRSINTGQSGTGIRAKRRKRNRKKKKKKPVKKSGGKARRARKARRNRRAFPSLFL